MFGEMDVNMNNRIIFILYLPLTEKFERDFLYTRFA